MATRRRKRRKEEVRDLAMSENGTQGRTCFEISTCAAGVVRAAADRISKTASHRRALLRNLVTSLIQHERISTTVAKAKEAQREAEKIITKAKRATLLNKVQQHIRARDYVFDRETTVPKLAELAERYRERPGGYTRLHLHGARQGDNAPRALLELVDSSKGDLKMELVARTLARETFLRTKRLGEATVRQEIETFGTRPLEHDQRLRELTRLNVLKLVKFGGAEARAKLAQKAQEHYFRLMATEAIDGPVRIDEDAIKALGDNKPRGGSKSRPVPYKGPRRWAACARTLAWVGQRSPAG
ncbi:hypothetical protein L7F22_056771 [Adiantum nelumboides]|nr:hypothetical protein [Adiantum nelumboides]